MTLLMVQECFKFILTKMNARFEMGVVGNHGLPRAERASTGSVMFNPVRALTSAKTRTVLTENSSERQTMFNLFTQEENIVADLAVAKASTFPVQLGRSVSIHKGLPLQQFTILEFILAQLYVSSSYMLRETLNSFLKRIQRLSHPPFQLHNLQP